MLTYAGCTRDASRIAPSVWGVASHTDHRPEPKAGCLMSEIHAIYINAGSCFSIADVMVLSEIVGKDSSHAFW